MTAPTLLLVAVLSPGGKPHLAVQDSTTTVCGKAIDGDTWTTTSHAAARRHPEGCKGCLQ